ncbi:MAG TPA: Uma2 family endonuclease [Ktedonobacteraceae bacterium]|nr:Uma2 family endonuclease [Ktedonobacteraceae bacterium]
MIAQPSRLRMSVEDYLTLDRNSVDIRYEYIDGYAYMMSGGTANHSTIGINITSLLSNLLRNGPCRVYNSDMKVHLYETRYVYPDATVSCNENDRGNVETIQSPLLIVEVLSPGTEAYDRGDKFAYYRACPTIKEYVLVNTQRRIVEVYRRARTNLWTLHLFEADDRVEFASLNITFPIAEIYRYVDMPGEDLDNSPA